MFIDFCGGVRAAFRATALLLCLQAAHAAQSWPMTGKVIHVEDGDTLTLLQSDYSKVSVRLSDIDAPETSMGEEGQANHTAKPPNSPYWPLLEVSKPQQHATSATAGSAQSAQCSSTART